MIKIKLKFDYILIVIKLNFDYKQNYNLIYEWLYKNVSVL
jgi:hypothetical protein